MFFHSFDNGFIGDVVKGSFIIKEYCQVVVFVVEGLFNSLDSFSQGSVSAVAFPEGMLVGVIWYLCEAGVFQVP